MTDDDEFDIAVNALRRAIAEIEDVRPDRRQILIYWLMDHFRRDVPFKNERVSAMKDQWMIQQSHAYDAVIRWCESPIEELVVAAFLMEKWRPSFKHEFSPEARILDDACVESLTNPCPIVSYKGILHSTTEHALGVIVVQATMKVGDNVYRADLLFIPYGREFESHRTIIELDGHDFHERTKQQAQRDKSRDRDFTTRGWSVLRFTGSEVHANPWVVCEAIKQVCDNKLRAMTTSDADDTKERTDDDARHIRNRNDPTP